MGMIDKEKVLHGLSSCGTDIGIPNICELTECPYRGEKAGCVHRLANDAEMLIAELLKAQEPRVMTLEEVKAAAGHDVWLELSGNIADDVMFAATIEGCGTKGLCTRYESLNYSAYGIRPYGWRCWTSRPTDEQREAVKWE